MVDMEILEGAIDLHVHSSPDVWPRRMDFLEVARNYRDAGLKGILLKNHFGSSVGEAFAVNQTVDNFTAFGSVTLNAPSGGLNPAAAEAGLKRGARLIFMPTMSSANQIKHWGRVGEQLFDDDAGEEPEPAQVWYYNVPDGISVLEPDGTLKQSVRDILELIAEHDAVLATGHIGPEEIEATLEAAEEAGVERRVITHASFDLIDIDAAFMKKWARRGVYMEHCAAEIFFEDHKVPVEEIAHCIREAGVEQSIISTDAGSTSIPPGLEVYTGFLEKLAGTGVAEKDMRTMLVDNPGQLLKT